MRTTRRAAPVEATGPMTAAPMLHAMAVTVPHATVLPSLTLLREASAKTSGRKRSASTAAITTSKHSPAEAAPRYRSAPSTASCPRSVALGATGRTPFAIATPSLLVESTPIAPLLCIAVAAPRRLPAGIRGRRRLHALPMPNVRRSPMVDASRHPNPALRIVIPPVAAKNSWRAASIGTRPARPMPTAQARPVVHARSSSGTRAAKSKRASSTAIVRAARGAHVPIRRTSACRRTARPTRTARWARVASSSEAVSGRPRRSIARPHRTPVVRRPIVRARIARSTARSRVARSPAPCPPDVIVPRDTSL
jgi:hypothetical protein